MSYRVEVSPDSTAECQQALCKRNKSKIPKGQLRLGTWVEHPGQRRCPDGSWK